MKNLKAALEISILLHQLRNYLIFEPGLYYLEFCCFCTTSNKPLQAQPMCIESFSPRATLKSLDNIKQGSVNESEGTINSKTFVIRSSESKIKLEEILTFYLELPENAQSIFIQVELMYSKITKKGLKSLKTEHLFSSECVKTIEISSPLQGILSFFPLQFNNKSNFSVDSIVSICFYDFIFPSEDQKELAVFFFPNKQETLKKCLGGQEIDRKYSEIISKIVRCRDQLVKTFESLDLKSSEKFPSFHLPLCSQGVSDSLAEALTDHDPIFVSQQILSEVRQIALKVYETFDKIKYNLLINLKPATKSLKNLFKHHLHEKCKEFIIRSSSKSDSALQDQTKVTSRAEKVKKMRTNEYFNNLESLIVQEANFLSLGQNIPLIFEETFKPSKPSKFQSKYDFHLVVLVHGFQGNSFDMQLVSKVLAQAWPKLVILDSAFNENRTDGDISEMGERLAEEIVSFMSLNFGNRCPLISFIGHSLGGLIIRAALPLLEFYSTNFHFFISLSTPHLGLLYSGKLLETGIWIMKQLKNFESLSQMGLKDSEEIENSFIYKLSFCNGLQWFTHVVLVSSSQDEYAPFSSARVEICEKSANDLRFGEPYKKMVQSLIEKLSVTNVVKLDVHFKLHNSIDTMIGRSAHLQLLENEDFLKVLIFSYPELFTT
jgi:hypothetical protein